MPDPASPARPIELRTFDLPLTTLQVGVCGEGPPVIVVPATISLIEDWEPLIRFLGRRYKVYFFELPGHGGSTPFAQPYRSELVAETVGHLADAIGAERFGLLGFSFGGLLALRTLQMMPERVEKLGLLSPYVGKETLLHSRRAIFALRAALLALRPAIARRGLAAALHTPAVAALISWFMRSAGKFETPSDLQGRLQAFTRHSLAVLLAQTAEILDTPASALAGPYDVPCLFGMSVFDTMLDFTKTRDFLGGQFPDMTEDRWDYPFHAPPKPFTIEDYERDYQLLLGWR